MSNNTAVDTVSGLDYEEIEQAVMETARGRWFLTEFARRQRGADTKLLLDAIRRLEDQLLAAPAITDASCKSATPLAASPENNAAAPAADIAREQLQKPVLSMSASTVKKPAPAFAGSDDDLFDDSPKPASSHAQAQAAHPAQAVGPDTLDFSAIEMPPLPDRLNDDEGEGEGENNRVKPKAVEPAPVSETAPEDIEEDLKARDRLIQVTRSSNAARRLSDFGTPPCTPDTPHSNAVNPAATNQNTTAENPAPAARSAPAATGSVQATGSAPGKDKKRIIVIRRPADSEDTIPFAGESPEADGNGPGAA